MKMYKVWSFYTETSFVWAYSASEAIEHYAKQTGTSIKLISARVMTAKEVVNG